MELFRLLGEIAIDGTQANRTLDDIARRAGMTSAEVETHFNSIGTAATNIMRGMGVIGLAVGGAVLAVTEGTREYRTQMNMLGTAFNEAGHSSDAAKKTYSELNAVLGDSAQATEAAQMLAVLADNEQELTAWTDIATGVYARMGEAIPIEELAASSSETAKSGILTGGLVDALIQAGHSEEDFQAKLDACSTEQERQKLIMDTLNGSYKNASEQYKETNKDILAANKAQERLTDSMAELGRIAEPIITAIKNKIADMVMAAVPHIENLVNKVKDMRKWIEENEDTVEKWKAGIIAATVSVGTFLLILNWGAIMAAASKAVTAVRTAVLLFNATLLANPIALVISLLAGLVAGFIYLWNTNEDFRQFWIDLWAKIRSACDSAIQGIKNKFNDLKDAAGKVKTWFEDIRKAISEKIESAWKTVSGAVGKIKGMFPLSIGKIFSNLKIPKLTVSGGEAPYGIAGKGKMPSFDVKWNAEGAIFTKPTIFNTRNGLQGVGEAGAEAVLPVAKMLDYVSTAVRNETGNIGQIIIEQNRLLMDFLRRNMPNTVQLDSGAMVGALLPAVDTGLADRWGHVRRGNVR